MYVPGGIRDLGDVDPGLREQLNPSVERLMALVLELQEAAAQAE